LRRVARKLPAIFAPFSPAAHGVIAAWAFTFAWRNKRWDDMTLRAIPALFSDKRKDVRQ